MSKTFFVLSIAGALLSSACIINTSDDDDDDGADDAADDDGTSNATTASTTAAADSSSGESSSGAGDSSSGTAGGGSCGWGDLPGQTNVTMGYTCGGTGEDPDGIHPLACPAGLAEGEPCGTVMGVGCCDADGNAWFCADDGTGTQQLYLDACT